MYGRVRSRLRDFGGLLLPVRGWWAPTAHTLFFFSTIFPAIISFNLSHLFSPSVTPSLFIHSTNTFSHIYFSIYFIFLFLLNYSFLLFLSGWLLYFITHITLLYSLYLHKFINDFLEKDGASHVR